MKSIVAPFIAFRRFCQALGLITVTAVLQTACVTPQVKSVITEADAALLDSQLKNGDFPGDPDSGAKPADLAATARKIDEFIAGHPDQKAVNGALRIRQAQLYLMQGNYESARASFAVAADLKSDRDKALKSLAEPLVWWWEHSSSPPVLTTAQLEAAGGHLAAFDREIAGLSRSPDIRDFLAEVRVRIALRRTGSMSAMHGPQKKEALVDAINHYGAIFTADDIAALKSGNLRPNSAAVSTAERRRLRALPIIERIRKSVRTLETNHQPVIPNDLSPSVQAFGALVLNSA